MEPQPHSVFKVADAFLDVAEEAGETLSNMKLQKLVFLAQGFALAILDRPLIANNVHAWQWGPVFPRLYKEFRQYGAGTINGRTRQGYTEPPLSDEEMSIVRSVWGNFGKLTASQLSSLTHVTGSPWEKTWHRDQYGVIPLEDLKSYYAELVNSPADA